jgi:hypothetical protein
VKDHLWRIPKDVGIAEHVEVTKGSLSSDTLLLQNTFVQKVTQSLYSGEP